MTDIHTTAIIDSNANIGEGVVIGPYCVVEAGVTLQENVVLHSHVVVGGLSDVGAETEIYPFASIGLPPQDLKYAGESSKLKIGRRNRIREHVTMNPGTADGGMITRVGDDCLFMVGAHVAHDCRMGDHVIMANNATLAGHVVVGDYAILGGLSAVHQFVRIGRHAIIGGMSGVENDVIPYGSVMGDRARLKRAILRRMRFSSHCVCAVCGMRRIDDEKCSAHIQEIVDFMRADSSRGLTQPR